MEKRFAKQGITFRITDEAKKRLVELGNNKDMGARPLRRVLTKTIEDGVTQAILGGSGSREFLFDIVNGDVSIVDNVEEVTIKEVVEERA
jgi:ATP-dependent Clp protease ATP-binding subunit ClpA